MFPHPVRSPDEAAALKDAEYLLVGGRVEAVEDQGLILSGALGSLRVRLRPGASAGTRELQPETCFTYLLLEGTPTLHFLGGYIPAAGDCLTIHYTTGYAIEGLDEELSSTLPEALEGALVDGAAAQACLLRAGSLVGRYGSDPRESARLMGISQLWRATFERTLNGLKVMQEFGFPPGFALDHWDQAGK